MKSDIQKFTKIIEIAGELYEDNPKYFVDCFFNMYFQMKKKKVIDERCYGDKESVKKVWSAVNYFNKLIKEKSVPSSGEAFNLAYRTKKVDKDLFNGVINSCRAFKSAKKTKFKNLY